jgi:hypothetical protein
MNFFCDPPVPWRLGRIELGHALRSVTGLYRYVSVFSSAAVSVSGSTFNCRSGPRYSNSTYQSGNGSAHSRSSRQTNSAERSLSGWAPFRSSTATATSPWVRKWRRYWLRLRHRMRLRQQQHRHHPSTQPLSKTLVLYAISLLFLTMSAVYVNPVWRG